MYNSSSKNRLKRVADVVFQPTRITDKGRLYNLQQDLVLGDSQRNNAEGLGCTMESLTVRLLLALHPPVGTVFPAGTYGTMTVYFFQSTVSQLPTIEDYIGQLSEDQASLQFPNFDTKSKYKTFSRYSFPLASTFLPHDALNRTFFSSSDPKDRSTFLETMTFRDGVSAIGFDPTFGSLWMYIAADITNGTGWTLTGASRIEFYD